MSLIRNNPFGQDMADFNEENSACRIGERIRTIRALRGMSQAELGKAVGLSSDRIQKYENGVRKPKTDMLKQFAVVLDVEVLALMDPVVSNYIGAMYAFFEMEEAYELNIINYEGKYLLQFGNGNSGPINHYLCEWYEKCKTVKIEMDNKTDKEKEEILKEYQSWKKIFPKGVCNKTKKELEKARLIDAISSLQEKLDKLNEEN